MEFHLTTDAGEGSGDLVQKAADLQLEVEAALQATCGCPLSFAQTAHNFPPVAPPPPPPPATPAGAPTSGPLVGGTSFTEEPIFTAVIGLGAALLVAGLVAGLLLRRRQELRCIRLNGRKMHFAANFPEGCKFHTVRRKRVDHTPAPHTHLTTTRSRPQFISRWSTGTEHGTPTRCSLALRATNLLNSHISRADCWSSGQVPPPHCTCALQIALQGAFLHSVRRLRPSMSARRCSCTSQESIHGSMLPTWRT